MAEDMAADPIADMSDLDIPLDAAFFSTDFSNNNNSNSNDFMLFNENDDVLDLDFTFDDINLPSDTEDFLNSTFPDPLPSYIPDDSDNKSPDDDPNFNVAGYFNLTSSSSDSPAKSPDLSSKGTSSQGSDNNWASSSGKVKMEDSDKKNHDLVLSKRKKENDDLLSESTRTIKYRRSNTNDNNNNGIADADAKSGGSAEEQSSNVFNEVTNDGDEKRKARLMRNRESAQLSRQRKKHYVEELEDKVRAMHSTIQDLNARISYVVAQNATLRHQMSGPPPIPGIYPPPMGYPWMPMPPYVVKPQGSQVPLVPIPRLKPLQQASLAKSNKRGEGKSKTKKVASVSFLGLLFSMLLFGGLVPMVNVKYGGLQSAFSGEAGSYYNVRNRFEEQRHGRLLMVNGTNHDSGTRAWKNYNSSVDCGGGRVGGAEANVKRPGSQEFGACSGNGSEPLVAALFVPRNDKLVKIDGNLIIHSVLASEKAKAERDDAETNTSRETSLAVAFNLAPSVSVPGVGPSSGRHSRLYRTTAEQQRTLAAGSAGKENLKTTPADGKLQQWFREGLAGPMLSSGMCTEVFQFDVSPAPGAIIPATLIRNVSAEESKNSTHLNNKGRSRRILHGLPIPLPGSANNISKESTVNNSQNEETQRNSSLSPMIVSVLVDPREVGDGDSDGMMGTKSLSRIFVVVLLDSVKYVTYSCMLPFMGSSHLVTA